MGPRYTAKILAQLTQKDRSPMPLYFFHVRHEYGSVEDEEGIDLPDTAAVYVEATRSACEFLADVASSGPMQLEITDTTGALVLRATLHDLAAAWQRVARPPRFDILGSACVH